MTERRFVQSQAGTDAATTGRRRVIVVGLDGSPTSWDAFAWAAGVAARDHCELVAVHVVPSTDPSAAAFGVPFDYVGVSAARNEIAADLKREAEGRGRELGAPVSFVAGHGAITDVISELARTLHADFVVVGRSTQVRHRVIGSLGQRLTCRPDAPVVVVVP